MLASLHYWKGMAVRDTGTYPNIDRWLTAFEARPSYIATKSDYYTHCQDIPPQYARTDLVLAAPRLAVSEAVVCCARLHACAPAASRVLASSTFGRVLASPTFGRVPAQVWPRIWRG